MPVINPIPSIYSDFRPIKNVYCDTSANNSSSKIFINRPSITQKEFWDTGTTLATTLTGLGGSALAYFSSNPKVTNPEFKKLSALENSLKKDFQQKLSKVEAVFDRLYSVFLDPITLEKTYGQKCLFPNCIMIESKESSVNRYLINWIKEKTACNYETVDIFKDDIVNQLEKAEEIFKKNRTRTLLHVPNLEDSINPALSKPHIIATMKDIMSWCATDYHSTLIFSTKDSSKLDYIAIQPHRVTIITPEFDSAFIGSMESTKNNLDKLSKELKTILKNTPRKTFAVLSFIVFGAVGSILYKNIKEKIMKGDKNASYF
ncbi:MAG: hypothetical protein PHX18_06705 [Candidatus Gastranaerophilales bacterium]|nr:hypothetical protein [Candidatus Gastranaerophilales bacterium]